MDTIDMNARQLRQLGLEGSDALNIMQKEITRTLKGINGLLTPEDASEWLCGRSSDNEAFRMETFSFMRNDRTMHWTVACYNTQAGGNRGFSFEYSAAPWPGEPFVCLPWQDLQKDLPRNCVQLVWSSLDDLMELVLREFPFMRERLQTNVNAALAVRASQGR